MRSIQRQALSFLIGCVMLMAAGTSGITQVVRPEFKCLVPPVYFPDRGLVFSPEVADDVAQLGASMLRAEFIREPDDTINYEAYDLFVDRAAERGMSTLGLVAYQTVPWGSPEDWATDAFRERFVQRVQEIVSHYHRRHHPIRHWEIWNEQDLAHPNFYVRIDPVPYAEILIECYHTIKAIDPTAVIVLGGLSPKGFQYETNYLQELYETPQLKRHYLEYGHHPFDVVACHPYPEIYSNPNRGLAEVMNQRIKAIMNTYGDRHKKVWLTEMGWNSAHVGESRQARHLRDSFRVLNALVDPAYPEDDPYIERYFWFKYEDFGTEDFWGLVTADYQRRKPAYQAYFQIRAGWSSPQKD